MRARDRRAFAAELTALKRRSDRTLNSLSRELDRPVSTIHGWISGRHLPYARDNDDFIRLLGLLGVTNATGWLESLSTLRSTSTKTDNPYCGLRPYSELESDRYFGREELVERLATEVEYALEIGDRVPIVVTGASGSGKTSLLRAGLVPRLRSFGQEVIVADAAHVVEAIGGSEWAESSPSVVVLDQFEAVLDDDGIVAEVATVVDGLMSRSDLVVVVGLRGDAFQRAASHPRLLAGLKDRLTIVGPMTTSGVTDVIVRPATNASLTVAPDLLTELVVDFSRHDLAPGATELLPMLSHVLYQLAEEPHDGVLTLSRYRSIGGLAEALKRTADDTLSTLDGCDHAATRALFLQLVEFDPSGRPTRRAVPVDRLRAPGSEDDLTVAMLEFTARRLLTIDMDTVTISHESLLATWPRLAGWIEELAESFRTASRVRSAAQLWAATDRDPSTLLRGSQLEAARPVLHATPIGIDLTANERDFVAASIDADDRRRRRDEEILSRQLAMQAEIVRNEDPTVSAELAVIAHRTAATIEARSALLTATAMLPGPRLVGSPGPTFVATSVPGGPIVISDAGRGTVTVASDAAGGLRRDRTMTFVRPPGKVYALAMAGDGRCLSVGASDGSLQIAWFGDGMGEAGRRVVAGIDFDGPVHSIEFVGRRMLAAGTTGFGCWSTPSAGNVEFECGVASTDVVYGIAGTERGLVATASRDGTIALWDLEDLGEPLWRHERSDRIAAGAVAFSPDGSTLVAGSHDGSVRVWRIGVHLEPVDIEIASAPFATWVNSLAFSPSGNLVAAASSDGTVRVWSTATWEALQEPLRHPTVVTAVRFTADRSLISAAEDGIVRSWPLADSTTSTASVFSMAFDRSGQKMLSASRSCGRLSLEDDRDGSRADRALVSPTGLTLSAAAAIAPTGDTCLLGTREGAVLATDGDGEARPDRLDGLTALVEAIAFDDTGSIACGADRDGNVQVWRLHADRFSPTGRMQVTPPAMSASFSADGEMCAIGTESGEVTLLSVDAADGPQAIGRLMASGSALGLAFHPGRPMLAVGSADRAVVMWDCSDPSAPTIVERLTGPAGNVMAVAFDHPGSRLAAGVTDGTAWVWDVSDVSSPDLSAVLVAPVRGVYALAFSPLDSTLIGGGPHEAVFSWTLDEHAATRMVESTVGDRITAEEWRRYVPALPYPFVDTDWDPIAPARAPHAAHDDRSG